MFYSGIDQHKRDSFITTYRPDGSIVDQERVGVQAEVGQIEQIARFKFVKLPTLHFRTR